MKKLGFIAAVLSCLAFLSGCPPFTTKEDIRQQEEDRQLKEQVSSIQKGHADNELKYSDIQNDIRVVAGRMDSLEHNAQVNQQNTHGEIENLKKLVVAQNEKLKLLEQHVDATEMRLSAAIQAIGNNAPPAAPAGNSVSETSGGDHQNLLEEGEALFAGKEYKKAIVKFQLYLDKHSKGAKAAEATYKIAVSFSELGLKKNAKEFYQETIESFPGSSQAKKAKVRLGQLYK